MEEVRSLLLGLQSIPITNPVSNLLASTHSGRKFASTKFNAPKLTCLDFPKFDRAGLHEWLLKFDQFYDYDGTLNEHKVRIAALHLEGKALPWHQNFMRNRLNRDFPSWNEYTVALNIRFGNDLHYDPMAELMNLKQLGLVQTYVEKFEGLMNQVCLFEEYTISCFIGGLKEELQYTVKMFAPRSLQQAIGLAKLQEKSMESFLCAEEKFSKEIMYQLPCCQHPS